MFGFVFFFLGYFKSWQLELQKVREEDARAKNMARILQKSTLGRILQAWRVVNQEECIIEPLVRRRVRRNMARWSTSYTFVFKLSLWFFNGF